LSPRITSLGLLLGLTVAILVMPQDAVAQARDFYDDIPTPDLQFSPPIPELRTLSNDVNVFYLNDSSLPLVSIFIRFKGGSASFPRTRLGAATAVPQLLRSGGAAGIAPDSIDRAMEFYAAETGFGGGGSSVFASLNTLTRDLRPVLRLWFAMLREPDFDTERVEIWRGRELEGVRRRRDNPGSLAISEYNRLMYGDHPIGWQINAQDLEPEDLAPEVLDEVHQALYCPANMTLGVAGAVEWSEIEPLLEEAMDNWPACPRELPDPPLANFQTAPGVFLIRKDLPQSTVIIGKPSEVRLQDGAAYFASRIGNTILGAGGFTSRLVAEVRTAKGYAYSASSVWTTPRKSRGIFGAITQTKASTTVAAIRTIVDIMEEMAASPPEDFEVRDAIARTRNGFVFNFQDGAQIVSRQMAFLGQDLPLDWLSRYVTGIQEVTPESVHEVIRQNMDPAALVILVLGNPDEFEESLDSLGPVIELDIGSGESNPEPRGGTR
jgi:zinc protease